MNNTTPTASFLSGVSTFNRAGQRGRTSRGYTTACTGLIKSALRTPRGPPNQHERERRWVVGELHQKEYGAAAERDRSVRLTSRAASYKHVSAGRLLRHDSGTQTASQALLQLVAKSLLTLLCAASSLMANGSSALLFVNGAGSLLTTGKVRDASMKSSRETLAKCRDGTVLVTLDEQILAAFRYWVNVILLSTAILYNPHTQVERPERRS